MDSNGASAGTAFKVAVRLRPLLDKERRQSAIQCVSVEQEHKAVVISKPLPTSDKKRQIQVDNLSDLMRTDPQNSQNFFFDIVFGPSSTQDNIYQTCAKHIILSVLEGYNGSIIAYGQTGTGKSYTIEGGNEDENRGLIPRSSEEIFSYIENTANSREKFLVRVSFLEIYNEKITDLLEPDRTNLRIREDGSGGMFVENLSEHVVKSTKDIKELIKKGTHLRTTAATRSNLESSRSHAIFTIIVEHSQSSEDGGTIVTIGKLRLADLAGSERLDVDSQSQRQVETKSINTSLLAYGKVVMALTSSSATLAHIPYRDSKLTKILQDSLGGNCKTTMITTISPITASYTESLNSLKFAKRAKHVKNNAIINKDVSQKALLSAYQQEIKQLREQLQSQGGGVPLSEDDLLKLKKEKELANQQKDKVVSELEQQKVLYDKAEKEKSEYKKRIAQLEAKLLQGGTTDSSSLKKVLEEEREKIKEDTKEEYRQMLAQIEQEKEQLKKDKEKIEKEKERIARMRSHLPSTNSGNDPPLFNRVGSTSFPIRSNLPMPPPSLATHQRPSMRQTPPLQSMRFNSSPSPVTSGMIGHLPSRRPLSRGSPAPSSASQYQEALMNYYHELSNPTNGIPCQNLTSGQRIFTGADAVTWFMNNMENVRTIERAIEIGNTLIQQRMIENMHGEDHFRASQNAIYQFIDMYPHNVMVAGYDPNRPLSAYSTMSIPNYVSSSQNVMRQMRTGSLPIVNTSYNNAAAGLDSSLSLSVSPSLATLELTSSEDITEMDCNNPTPLHIASYKGDHNSVKELAKTNNINIQDNAGMTPLMYAAMNNQSKCCNVLIKSLKANTELKDLNQNTALMLAVSKGHHEVVKVLLKNQAELQHADISGNNVFHIASADSTRIRCLQSLLKYSSGSSINVIINERNKQSQTSLHVAVLCHAHDTITLLLKNKYGDLGVSDSEGQTPLHYAILQKCRQCVQSILSTSPNDVNLVDINGMTALHLASMNGLIDLVELLLHPATGDVNMTNAEGMTALHLSTIKDQHQIVRLLLKNGGDKSIKDNNHKTPMDYATEMGLVNCLHELR